MQQRSEEEKETQLQTFYKGAKDCPYLYIKPIVQIVSFQLKPYTLQ